MLRGALLAAVGMSLVAFGPRLASAQQVCSGLAASDETTVFVAVAGDPADNDDGTAPTQVAVPSGTIRIPELELAAAITQGCASFGNIRLPHSPMLLSFEITAEGYRPSTWANYLVMAVGQQANFTPTLHLGTEPELIDPCPGLLAAAPSRSAAEQQHAQLCAGLPASELPTTGTGSHDARNGLLEELLAALAGAALVALGTARLRRA